MAALPEARGYELIDLRRLQPADLDPLLNSESQAWRQLLDWDFAASAELVRRFLRIQALSGYGMVLHGRVCGYAYYVCEERKALLGDLYVLPGWGGPCEENLLLNTVLRDLLRMPYLARIEAQLMMMRGALDRTLPESSHLHCYERHFMVGSLAQPGELRPHPTASELAYEPWREQNHEHAAQLIAQSYRGHVDARINDQYRSVAGARRFLTNIVQYPGCGSFDPDASLGARDAQGQLQGLCLASQVSEHVGHITQICVAAEARGTGVGYELLRRSMQTLAAKGCRKASLTVTAGNRAAGQLYESVGFETVRKFSACVWEGF